MNELGTWEALYKSDAQGVYALLVVPALFLLYLLAGPRPAPSRGVVPDAAPFVRAYGIVFALETMLDPIATGLLPRSLGIADAWAATAILVVFVLLGDLRVFALLFRLARPTASLAGVLGEAAAWTLLVPIVAFGVNSMLASAFPGLPGQTIWLVYELAFAVLAVYFRFVWLPRHVVRGARCGFLEDVVEYALAYYLLWAAADVLILVGGFDEGWALRVIPNQLYYSFYLPFVYVRFFTAKEQEIPE
ncbi:MAG: hypothetical protein ACREQJ_08910 [Candidatus Binatia bacterium]